MYYLSSFILKHLIPWFESFLLFFYLTVKICFAYKLPPSYLVHFFKYPFSLLPHHPLGWSLLFSISSQIFNCFSSSNALLLSSSHHILYTGFYFPSTFLSVSINIYFILVHSSSYHLHLTLIPCHTKNYDFCLLFYSFYTYSFYSFATVLISSFCL